MNYEKENIQIPLLNKILCGKNDILMTHDYSLALKERKTVTETRVKIRYRTERRWETETT